MTCQQVQTDLSLYIYGELDFAREEELEQHLHGCAFCQLAFSREKTWHTALHSEHTDVSLDLLQQCRRDLREVVRQPSPAQKFSWRDLRLWGGFRFGAGQWSQRLAFASFFLFAGFSLSTWMNRAHLTSQLGFDSNLAGLVNTPSLRVRDIQPDADNKIRIVIDRVQEGQVVGTVSDEAVRSLLLAAARNTPDPSLRVDSVRLLNEGNGADIRDALFYVVQHDQNPAVRLKALEGLKRFMDDQSTRETLRSVLQYDVNPAVRSEVINVLVPVNGPVRITPELAVTLEEIARSEQDNYLRSRCVQVLQILGAPPRY